MSESTNPKSKRPKQASNPSSRRQRLRQEQEQAERQAKNRRNAGYAVIGVIAALVVGLVVWVAVSGSSKQNISADSASEYAVVVGKADAPVVVDIYQDFICPWCGEFERINRADLTSMADTGQARIRIHPMAFLDDASQGTEYSTRAANAFVTVYKAEPDKALAFSEELFENQPAENSTGLTDTKIAELAKKAGVSDATIATFAQLSSADFVAAATKEAFASGVTSTPTVLINGTKFTGNIVAAGELKAAVEKAAGLS